MHNPYPPMCDPIINHGDLSYRLAVLLDDERNGADQSANINEVLKAWDVYCERKAK